MNSFLSVYSLSCVFTGGHVTVSGVDGVTDVWADALLSADRLNPTPCSHAQTHTECICASALMNLVCFICFRLVLHLVIAACFTLCVCLQL